jgi:hypothetical protein
MKTLLIYFILVINIFVSNFFLSQTQIEKTPIIFFSETTHDYGKIDSASNGVYEFVFKNEGFSDLIIYDAKGSCGCTVPTYPTEPIKPGQTAVIKVMYDTNKVGYINKSVTLSTNASNSDNGFVVLRIKGEVLKKQ